MTQKAKKHVFRVIAGEAGMGLEGFVSARMACSPGVAEEWVRGGGVYVDGRRVRDPALRVVAGARVLVYEAPRGRPAAEEPEVAYSERELAVVCKPAGLLTEAGRTGGEATLDTWVRGRLGSQARVLHRLDREASGLLLVSLGPGAARVVLAREVSEHRLVRRYLAVVLGELPEGPRELRGRIAVEHGRARGSDDPRARPAVTHLRPLRVLGGRTLVQLELETGRTHQLRVQLSEAGHPLVGDSLHGGPEAPRLALHAHQLALRRPGGGWLDVHAPLPAGFRAILYYPR